MDTTFGLYWSVHDDDWWWRDKILHAHLREHVHWGGLDNRLWQDHCCARQPKDESIGWGQYAWINRLKTHEDLVKHHAMHVSYTLLIASHEYTWYHGLFAMVRGCLPSIKENSSLCKSVVSLDHLCESGIAAAFVISAIVKNDMCYWNSKLDLLSTRARQSVVCLLLTDRERIS